MKFLHLVPRSVARERGFSAYFTGEPCIRGHISTRRTADKRCRSCDLEKSKARYHSDPSLRERITASNQRRQQLERERKARERSTPEAIIALQKRQEESRRRTRARDNAAKAKKYASDPEYRARVNARNAAWHSDNVDKTNERVTRRRVNKLQRTPPWLTPAMKAELKRIYALARRMSLETGVPHEVDHVVPLQGERVSGLHVPWNLRVVPKQVNRSKHNRFE